MDVKSVSKRGNMVKMITLLQSRGRMKASEIAQELEVSERQVRTYRNDLEMGGIFVKYISGRYGGYELVTPYLCAVDLTQNELAVLNMVKEQLIFDGNLYAKDYNAIYDKISAKYKKHNYDINLTKYYTISQKANFADHEITKRFYAINYAIITKRKTFMEYDSLTSGKQERIVHPYSVYTYKNDLYMIGYCETRKEVLDFKMVRIVKLETLEEHFEQLPHFKLGKYYANTIGNFKDDAIAIKLKISHPFSTVVSEKIWAENQNIKWIDKETIIFTASLRGYTEIKSWILSMGRYVEVLEPAELVEDVCEELDIMMKHYLCKAKCQ